MKVLVLAGDAGGRVELVELLSSERDIEVVASLAGHTSSPAPLPCSVRSGGFGGIDGLHGYLRAENIGAIVDATHPFSARMPHHARSPRPAGPVFPASGCAGPPTGDSRATAGSRSTTWSGPPPSCVASTPGGSC